MPSQFSGSPMLKQKAWCWALMAVLVLVVLDSFGRISHNQYLNQIEPVSVQPIARDASSPSGYEFGQGLRMLPPGYAIDGYHWIMQTQHMLANGALRIRHVNYDNSPSGREVQWAAPFHWWLGFLAWIDHAFTGVPLGQGVERAALYANPLLLIIFLLLLVWAVARKLGPKPALWLALGLGLSVPFYSGFLAAGPDHHGLVAGCALLTIFGISVALLDWAKKQSGDAQRSDDTARLSCWIGLSGIAGGAGLWISAATMAPLLAGIGIGGFIAGWRVAKTSTGAGLIWKKWGRWGAAASLGAWLVEYLPGDASMRLEVNHPLYALAWLGAGELLGLWWSRNDFSGQSARGKWWLMVSGCLIAIALLPGFIFFGGPDFFRISDPFVWRLHHEYIGEFQNCFRYFGGQGTLTLLLSFVIPAGLFVSVLIYVSRRSLSGLQSSVTWILAAASVVFLAMAMMQVRWMGMALALVIFSIAVMGSFVPVVAASRWGRMLFYGLAFFAMAPSVYLTWAVFKNHRGLSRQELTQLVDRELAWWLRLRTGSQPPVIATSPSLATTYVYHSGGRTLGTLYWENAEGLHTTADFFGARSEAEAYRIAQKTRLTHVVIPSWNSFLGLYVQLGRGLRPDDQMPANAFANQLLLGKLPPPWLRPLAYALPENPAFKEASVIIYEVTAPRSPERVLVDHVNFLIDRGDAEQAKEFMAALNSYPDYLPVAIARARLPLLQRREQEFVGAMRQVLAHSDQFSILGLEDRVQLALELAVLGDDQNAAIQLTQCWEQARSDESSLRKLSGDAIVYLLQQSQRLRLNVPRSLRDTALGLVSPAWRQQL